MKLSVELTHENMSGGIKLIKLPKKSQKFVQSEVIKSSSKTLESYNKHLQKVTTEVTRKLATINLELIKDFEPSIQHAILEKFIDHFILQNVILAYLINVQSIKRNQEILSNMKYGITSHLVGPK